MPSKKHAHEEKNGAVHSEATPRLTKGQKLKRTCAKWWWLFFLIFAAIVLIIVLPIVYVAYPKIAREAVANAQLNVTSMSILNPAPDHVDLSFEEVFISDSKYHPTLYPFNASFYLLDNKDNPPFASVRTPQLKAGNGIESTVPAQQVNITHLDEFTRYVLLALGSEEFTIALRGTGDLKQGILPRTSADYDTNITMKGFNRLAGFEVTEFHVLNETRADGTNAVGTASIPNPTVMEIDLGTVTLAMSTNGTDIGHSTIDSLILKPGDNMVQMRAEVYQLVVVGIVVAAENPILPVDIKGNQSTVDGEVIPYYTTMLQATSLSIELNVTEAVDGSGLI